MASWPILSVTTFLPIVGVLFIAMMRNDEAGNRNIRWVALWTTIVTFAVSLIMLSRFDAGSPEFQFVEKREWLGGFATYRMGVDGISLPFVILTTALMPLCIAASWLAIQKRVKEYMIAFLVLETLMVGTFSALDLVLFYLFFEGGLIPMFLIIGVWGGPRRVYASFKFFLYTLLGSVLMLLAIMAMYWQAGTTDIPTLLQTRFPANMQIWLWLAFFASFAVKMPMWPVHTWLPDAHVEAPTAGSVILAAILLKMGGYGFLRFSLPMFPDASVYFQSFVYVLSVVAIIYTSLVALMQEDMKKLIAYSSVAHMGYVTMGLFAMTPQGDAIFPGLTVREHLDCGAHAKSAWRERAKRRQQVYRLFPQLDVLQDSLVGKLSGGERRMVSIGRALMSDARLYLIDEPTLGLAPKVSRRVIDALANIPLDGKAMVIAEQNVSLLTGSVTRMPETFGPLFSASSPSAGLQRSLASRLRAALDVNGSLEYELTWSDWAMPSGPPICALRASGRRTSGSGSTSWHTPTAKDGDSRTHTYDRGDPSKVRLSNEGVAGWPTPAAISPGAASAC